MIIVVNTQSWNQHPGKSSPLFFKELFIRLACLQKEHSFYFLSEQPIVIEELPPNLQTVVVPSIGRGGLRTSYWENVKVPMWLKKIKADILIHTDGITGFTTKAPQCLLLNEPPIAKAEESVIGQSTLSLRLLQKAKTILVPSESTKEAFIKQFNLPAHKIISVQLPVRDVFAPAPLVLKESVKALYTGGQEFFLYKGPVHTHYNLVNLLKGFSIFKKRQRSSWKLVFAGHYPGGQNDFLPLLETYKYKEDVIVTGPLTPIEETEIVGAAYALASPSYAETLDLAVLEALQCEVPVLAIDTTANKEVLKEAALYFNGLEPASIAEQLMLLYKDEEERHQLVEKGKIIASAFSWNKTTSAVWQSLLKTANT